VRLRGVRHGLVVGQDHPDGLAGKPADLGDRSGRAYVLERRDVLERLDEGPAAGIVSDEQE
jgi:hypothetical protein